ncbi:biotin carboxyl carrier protein /biotin carboxylase [Saccharopolyspora erythraea NRRL 2338]|uniref:Biotin-dependent acyl-coenzyme A carboxylase alpha3 subunit n=3 Tax=Saccharopolyspora erythraea TaxID=1836 RepID=A4FNQ3_SACEN|nr:biotin carboxylase N-terminal domain-containing protein [Saccharopolyspora erythraea]PFG99316.1 biotin carboxyl carrier protein /biotin carboxylase [Saccharopolyspora erythraea NRRL 2338]QRK89250.1 ATP-grasp domain-containing protein [Saccharopolyspora erythraea]CAA63308.1 biotin carboxylase and biotin carboxyl carrier protein [Saccharopolyspora erythraea NRRL 2338]CAM05678.1 acetyl/propionyl-CoA carboxylase alpha subunit [Saccharopolyspora erythraea NRRL 2338]
MAQQDVQDTRERTAPLRKVLVANRGEIAVRVIRACRDVGVGSVAVYAEPDVDAVFVRLADEAFGLGGSTAAESYLDIGKVIDAAQRSGADAVHPGYGFLSENADFAQAVLDAGLVWVGPSPEAIRVLGDKVTARRIALEVGAPLVPGTEEPASGADEVVAFAEEHGLPVAIKAAFGGGGRGLKVARSLEEIPGLFESAVREAEAAFGRGECFVERYLDRPRHVEAQVLADRHGGVVVVGTRDCSLQRRHQKLVEEAPAPFLSEEQRERIHTAAREICARAGYAGAGTVEFLVGADGTISFLEVNTRLQVEHPVSEETTGLDLVVEQLRIAAGERLWLREDPVPVGHAIEFRINGEDPGRDFLPAPGTVRRFVVPSGPGVRVDAGVESGSVIGGQFDSLLAKVIVWGRDRAQALARSRRVLAEMRVEGLATVLPFHRAVVADPAFTAEDGFGVHTRWIETEFDNTLPPFDGASEAEAGVGRRTVVVEVGGRRLEVSLPADLTPAAAPAGGAGRPRRRSAGGGGAGSSGDAVTAPMQGTLVKLVVAEGDRVSAGDEIAVLEAMKMENPVLAHKDGTVTGLTAQPGATLTRGSTLCELKD